MPLQAALFDTEPLTRCARYVAKAEAFAEACRLIAPLIAEGHTDADIERRGALYTRFPLADIRAHLETIERTQERMF